MRRSGSSRLRLSAAAVLAAAVVAIYWPMFSAGFVNLDDPDYVVRNPQVHEGFTAGALRWAWTTGHSANWHPLTWMSHILDWKLFGGRAGGHHAVSILLHAANAVLLFLLLERLTAAPWRSATVAALFAVHPLHVESVAWIAERKDVLSAFFGLLALLAYARFAARPSAGRMAGVAALLAAGLCAKPMLVTLPFVMLLLDVWPLRRVPIEKPSWSEVRPRLVEKAPLFALAAASAVATYLVQRSAQALALTEKIGLPLRAANAALSLWTYLRDTVWPSGLAAFYPHPGKDVSTLAAAAATAALVALTVAAVRWRRSRPYLLVGWLWYLGTLVPVLGLVQVGSQGRADRYTYLPLVGIFIAVVWGCGNALDVLARRRGARALDHDSPARLWPILAVLPALAVGARVQAATWTDSITLWTHALHATGPNPEAHVHLANALAERGDLDGAETHYREALRSASAHPDALNGLGLILVRRGRPGEAIPLFERAIASRPFFADPHANLATTLSMEGRPEEALRHAETASRLAPDLPEARSNAGALLLHFGRLEEAIRELTAACRLDPGSAGAHKNLGIALLRANRPGDAVAALARAVELKPDDAAAHAQLAVAHYLGARYAEAWKEIALARRYGFEPPPELVQALSQRMADPGRP